MNIEANRPPLAVRVLRGLWRTVDGARRLTVNLLFVLVVALVAALLLERGPRVPNKAALVLAPVGTLVEQLSGDPGDRAWGGSPASRCARRWCATSWPASAPLATTSASRCSCSTSTSSRAPA